MTGIEFRTRPNGFTPYCPDCWQQLEPTNNPTDPASYNHQCDGKRNIQTLTLELVGYEDTGTDVHPEDYITSAGFEIVAYEGDQADYCVHIAVKPNDLPLPEFVSESNHVFEAKSLR